MESKINFLEYELENGETVKMSAAPILLLKLRNKNEKAYKNMNAGLMSKEVDLLGTMSFLYGAYLCGNLESDLSFSDFLEVANEDFEYNMSIFTNLVQKRKKQDSVKPL